MVFKYGFIQFFRSKWMIITFVLFMLMGLVLTLSCSLWVISDNNIQEYDRSFSTIGFAKQTESKNEVVSTWDAGLGDYTYSDKKVYPEYRDTSALNFYHNYVIKPEQRPFYTAFCDKLKYFDKSDEETWVSRWGSVIVFEPYKTSVPNKPTKVKIVEVLWGNDKAGSDIWLCDHFNEHPPKIEVGHKYATSIQSFPNQHKEVEKGADYESNPVNLTISSQFSGKSVSSADNMKHQNWEEITKESDLQKWKELAKAYDRLLISATVTPAPSSKMIYEFHEGTSSVVQGADISNDQYKNGDKVCLVPLKYAKQNGVGVGDEIKLSFYMANYRDAPSQVFYPSGGITLDYGLLNDKGENYPVVEEAKYKIVGLYAGSNKAGDTTGFELGANEIIVPEKSISGDYSKNIVAYGPMNGYNTAFIIPNGEAADYMSKMTEADVKDIDVSFFDNGYEQLVSGMRSMKQIAFVSALVSLFALLASLLLFCYLVVQKQRSRTATERLLGLTAKQCFVSLPLPFLLTILAGSAIGAFSGYYLADFILSLLNSNFGNSFILDYSIWNNSAQPAVAAPSVLWVPAAAIGMIVLNAVIITTIIMSLNRKSKPLTAQAAERG